MRAIGRFGLALLLLLAAGPAWAQADPDLFPRLRLEWQAGQDRAGRPLLWGYLHNDNGRHVADVRLLVESLDAAGQPTARTVGFLDGTITFGSRGYFEVRPGAPGATYRVRILSVTWQHAGGGGG